MIILTYLSCQIFYMKAQLCLCFPVKNIRMAIKLQHFSFAVSPKSSSREQQDLSIRLLPIAMPQMLIDARQVPAWRLSRACQYHYN